MALTSPSHIPLPPTFLPNDSYVPANDTKYVFSQPERHSTEISLQVDGQGTAPHDKEAAAAWHHLAAKLSRDLLTTSGLDAGPCELMLHLRPCEGLIRCVDGTIEKRFSKSEHLLPVQVQPPIPSRDRGV